VSNTASPQSEPVTPPPLRRAPDWAILAVVCLGQFMVILDVSIVNVALPSIRNDLHFTSSGLQWIVNAYTIVFAGFLLLGGRAADLFGQRRLFLLGMFLFTAASLVGGFAQSRGMLIAARSAQGLGGAVLSPATLTILTTTFREGPARAKALGAWSAVAGAGGAAGALLGGILTDFLSWRWILFVNVPIGVIGMLAARLVLAERKGTADNRSLDVVGAILVTGGLLSLVSGIVESDSKGWTSSTTSVLLVAGVALLAIFVAYEARFAKAPLMPLRLFRSRSVSASNCVMFFLGAATFAMWYFLSLYVQNILGYSPLGAGLVFLPQTVAIILGAQVSSRLVWRMGPRPLLIVGGAVTTIGLAWLAAVPVHGSYLPNIFVPSVLTTLGIGLSFTPIAMAATSGVAPQDAGLASGLVNTMRQVGGSLGLAVLATVAVDHTTSLLKAGHAPKAALVSGYDRAFLGGAILAVGCIIAALALPRKPATVAATEVVADESLSTGTLVTE
jgi:EmrB/QacA subfamily drug resistance transporter